MTTKTFHDIYDLVELVEQLENATIEITMNDGVMHFDVTNYVPNAQGLTESSERITIDETSIQIRGFCENIDKAYRLVEEKIASGAWKKNDDAA